MRIKYFLFSLVFLTGSISFASAFDEDSLPKRKTVKHSATLATLFSAAVPGLGQAYNKKYWKIPIVHASMGVSIYFIATNIKEYKHYRQAYIYKLDKDSLTVDPYEYATETEIFEAKELYRRYRDISYIACGLFYILNIIDATVDAHFFSFDVSDDLSLNLVPAIANPFSLRPTLNTSLKLSYRF